MSRGRTKQGTGNSGTEVFVSIAFILCAVAAGFLVIHKKDIMEGNIDKVVASYVGGTAETD